MHDTPDGVRAHQKESTVSDPDQFGSQLGTTRVKRKWKMTMKLAYLLLLTAFGCLFFGIFIAWALSSVLYDSLQVAIVGSTLIGFIALILAGFGVWAGAKGYSPLLGIVLAWIGPIGMLILVFLKDKSTDS